MMVDTQDQFFQEHWRSWSVVDAAAAEVVVVESEAGVSAVA